MNDWIKGVGSVVTVGVVTVLSYLLLPESHTLHNNLTYGLLALTGVYGVGAGLKYTIERMRG